LTSTQTITGAKTFSTAPSISSIVNGGTITIPSGADAFVTTGATQSLSNKTIATLVATGSQVSLFGGKLIHNYVTSTTVGNVTNILLAVAIPTGTAISVDCRITGFCTASSGSDTGKYVVYNATFAAANNAGQQSVGYVYWRRRCRGRQRHQFECQGNRNQWRHHKLGW
jgi:hypothetical protein